ncbi:RICIN domain-containing protein, partial [Winogradskyella sp. F6397]
MNFLSIKKSKISILFFGLSIFTILGVSPYFFGPGLTQPESVGTFLNGNFPDVTASANPYQPAFPNLTFNSPLTFTTVPNSNTLIIGQQNGEIYSFENDDTVTTKNLVADLSNKVGVVWDGGFLGLEIHPEFGTPGKNYIYTYYTSKDENGNDYPDAFVSGFGCYKEDYWGGFSYLRRYEVDPVTFTVVPGSELTMIKIRMFSSSHRGGALEFGDDGFLYLTTGEQSAYTKSQNITTNLDGGVLRLDVDQDPTKSHNPIRTLNTGRFNDEISGVGYGIPNDNPFLSPLGDNFEEYYSIGHRNPHRLTKDALTGTMYIGEIGAGTHEEVNILSKGKNYGWPVYEGNVAGPGANCGGVDAGMYNNMSHEGPLVAFPRADANALMGGFVYRGTAMPEYYGKYICADYGIGEEIWVVDINTGAYELITEFSPTNIISFGEDNQGEIYLLSQGNNVSLYKMTQVNGSPLDNVPELLSETGAFQNLTTLTPSSGVLPYELVESFWSDGAEKKRWMVIPNDGTHDTPEEQINFSEDGDWEFPVGSVLIKHFELPVDDANPNVTKRLETRFSIKASTGDFYFLTYKWNSAGTEAVLLDSGVSEDIAIATTSGSSRYQTWTYPGTQDCIACHNPATNGSIGPRTRFLNSNITYPQTETNANQLVTLSHLGILDESIDDNTVLAYQTHKAIDDPNASLDERARSYLDNNCAYCHRPGGTGERAQFDLRLSNSLVDTGLMYAGTNEPVDGLDRIVIAGDAENSILFHRIESVDQTVEMPPIAKNVADQAGVDLIEEWINQLDPNYEDPTIDACTYTITNVGSGLVMDIAGVSQANGANVQQWTFIAGGNQLNQQFIVEPDGNGYYTIKAVHSDKFLDVQGAGQASGTNVIQYQGNGTDAQLFSFEYLGDNEYAIKSKTNNFYLGIENGSLNNGGSIKTYADDGSDFFKWTFTAFEIPVTGVTILEETAIVATGGNLTLTASVLPSGACDQNLIWSSSDETIALVDETGYVTGVAEGVATITATTVEGGFTDSTLIEVYDNVPISTSVFTITNVGSSLVMDVANGSQANTTDIVQKPGTLSDNQKFIVAPDGNGYYTIKPVHSNKNVDVQGAGQADGTNLIQHEENGTDAQLFSIIYLGNDMYAIQSKVNNLYVGIENNSLVDGASIKTYANDGSDFFKWGLTDLSTTYTFDGNNGWLPSDPNGTATIYDEIIVESGNAIISSNTTSDIINVNPGAALTINNGVTLTTNTTTLNSTSQTYASLIVDGIIEGTVKYERYVNANSGGNDLISPPLFGETWEDFLLSDNNAADILNDGNNNPRTYLFGP